MADHATPEAAEGGEVVAATPKKSGSALMIGVVALAAAAGGAVGFYVLAPRSAPAKATVEEGGRKPKDSGKEEAIGRVYRMDNLIVNPAGSQGARFLMVSLAVEAPDPKLESELKARDSQLRDLVITLLQQQTMETLSQPGIRDSIKRQVADTVSALVGSRETLRVYIPQFVIQ